MSSAEDICNLALSHVGSSAEIQDLLQERSPEAEVCRRFYEIDRDRVFRDFMWPFASQLAPLALVQENPNILWRYSYRYPSDCLVIDRIISRSCWPLPNGQYAGNHRDSIQSMVKLDMGQDSQGQLIFTNEKDAILKYTIRILDPTKYPADFTMAFSYLLAADIGPRISKGDSLKLSDRALANYGSMLSVARAMSANEIKMDAPLEAETIRARGDGGDGGWGNYNGGR